MARASVSKWTAKVEDNKVTRPAKPSDNLYKILQIAIPVATRENVSTILVSSPVASPKAATINRKDEL